jgi:hypothetical protein
MILSFGLVYLASFASAPVQCTVEVQGMPVGQLRYHELQIGDRVEVASAKMSFELAATESVRLTGPRYGGQWFVSPDACAAGPVQLRATPLPALVIFHCPPEEAVVMCRGCSPAVDGQYHGADEFPAFPMTDFRREVQFVLKAARYRERTIHVVVNPGRNEFDGRLSPR